jgi:hypothetical protein
VYLLLTRHACLCWGRYTYTTAQTGYDLSDGPVWGAYMGGHGELPGAGPISIGLYELKLKTDDDENDIDDIDDTDDDPSFDSVASLYPLLAHSREALGVADHNVGAALEIGSTSNAIGKPNPAICSVSYPLLPSTCSDVAGMCTTATIASAYFELTVDNQQFALNCSHSSTRSLKGFAPIVVAAPVLLTKDLAGAALSHSHTLRREITRVPR